MAYVVSSGDNFLGCPIYLLSFIFIALGVSERDGTRP